MDYKIAKGYLFLTVANICLGLNSPLSMSLFASSEDDHVSSFAMSSYRAIGAAILFWLYGLLTSKGERVAPRDLGLILIASIFGVQLNQFLYLWGLSLTSPIDAPIIAATVPIMTMVLAMIFLREPITTMKSVGVALGAIGAISIVLSNGGALTSSDGAFAGRVICILAALSYSIYLTLFKSVITKYSPVTTMKWMFLFSGIVASIIFRDDIIAVNYSEMPLSGWGIISFVVILGTFVPFLFVLTSQSVIRPTVVSMFNYFQPISAVVFSVLIGIGTFDMQKALSALSIFIGVWLVTRSKSRSDVEAKK